MERSENEIVAAPPFSTVQVKPPRFLRGWYRLHFPEILRSSCRRYAFPLLRQCCFGTGCCWQEPRRQAEVRARKRGERPSFSSAFCRWRGWELPLRGVISAGAESASGAAVPIFSPQFIQKTASSGIGLPYLGQNGQVAGRRGTQIFLKRTIVFALLDGVLLAFDLRELVYRAADDQQSSGDTNDEQGVSLRNFWRGGR